MDPLSIMALAEKPLDIGTEVVRTRRDRRYERKIHERDRSEQLADWNRQNEYDSPVQQMTRLKEAGLNPALIYGNGNTATGSGNNIDHTHSDVIESSPTNEFRGMAANYAQVEQMRIQNENMEMQRNLIAAQTMQTVANTDRTKLKTETERRTMEAIVEAASLKNIETGANIELKKVQREKTWQEIRESTIRMQKIAADIDFTLDENKRKELMSSIERGKATRQTQLITQQIISEMIKQNKMAMEKEKTEAERTKIKKNTEVLEEQRQLIQNMNDQTWAKFGLDIIKTFIK